MRDWGCIFMQRILGTHTKKKKKAPHNGFWGMGWCGGPTVFSKNDENWKKMSEKWPKMTPVGHWPPNLYGKRDTFLTRSLIKLRRSAVFWQTAWASVHHFFRCAGWYMVWVWSTSAPKGGYNNWKRLIYGSCKLGGPPSRPFIFD